MEYILYQIYSVINFCLENRTFICMPDTTASGGGGDGDKESSGHSGKCVYEYNIFKNLEVSQELNFAIENSANI